MRLGQLQDEVAQVQSQRALAKIGQLYLDQNKKELLSVDDDLSDNESDDDIGDNDGQETALQGPLVHEGPGNLKSSSKDFYHGFNPSDDRSGNPFPPFEDWVHIHDQQSAPSWETSSMGPPRFSTDVRNDAVTYQDDVYNDAVTYPVTMSHEEGDCENAHARQVRSHPSMPSQNPLSYEPNTAIKKNITKRRSQGRPRDRQSLGETSRPLESLVSKKSKPRPKDLDYAREVSRTPDASRVQQQPPSKGKFGGTFTPVPEFTRKHLPDERENPKVYAYLNHLWIGKKALEEDMNDALEENDERTYRAIELQHNQLNQQMFSLLHEKCHSQDARTAIRTHDHPRSPSPTQSHHSSASSSASSVSKSAKPGLSIPMQPAKPDGKSYLIYFEYRDELTPWMVWAHMPVSQLVSTAANLVNVYFAMAPQAPPGIQVALDAIVLYHNQRQMDIEAGRLSDYPVLPGDIVVVVPTLPGGGFGQNKTIKVKRQLDNANLQAVVPTRRAHALVASPAVQREGEQTEGAHSSRAHEKIKQSFKCPRFSGQPKDWKLWNKGFQRFLSIWDLEYVLDPDFFFETPFPKKKIEDNKLVYYILEDATQGSPLAASYVRQAPVKNGFEAYYSLHDGFVFAGTTSSTILLNELSNFRFKQDETPTELILRLEELFQDLEMLPDNAAMKFNDTQSIGYLLGALRHEPQWETVTSSITSSQIKGDITFRQACDELRVRCEADKAYKLIDKEVKVKRKAYQAKVEAVVEETADDETVEKAVKALMSTMSKRTNKETTNEKEKKGTKPGKPKYEKHECLAVGCDNQTTFPLCGNHYHSLVSGKTPAVDLRNDYGNATFNPDTSSVEYPPKVPAALLPKPRKQ